LLVAVWALFLLGQLQELQPWHLQNLPQILSLSRFDSFHAAWFFSQAWCGLKNVLLALGFFTAAFGLGSAVMGKFFSSPRPRLENLILSLALGLMGLAMLVFLIGVLHGLQARWFAPLLCLLVVWGCWSAWQHRKNFPFQLGWLLGAKPGLTEWVLGSIVILILAGEFFCAALPELFFDALVYHLGVPAQWIQSGGIVPLPTNFFSNFPMNVEMLYTGALLLSNEVLCRFLHVGLGILACLAAFALGRRWFGRRAGFWAAGILAGIPVFIMNALVAGVDAGSVFFALAALLTLLNAGLEETTPGRGFWLAGLLTGTALGCKYNTAFILVPATAFTLAAYFLKHRDLKKMAVAGAQIFVGAFLLFSPWLIKNTVFTGNPVYPFFFKNIPSRYVQPEKMQKQMDGFREFGQRTPGQILRVPWDLTFYYTTSNSYVGAVFLFLLPGLVWLGVRAGRAPPVQQVLLATAAAGAVIWITQTQIARYFLPGFAVLAVLGGALLAGLERVSPGAGKTARWSVLVLLVYSLVNTAAIGIQNWNPLGMNLGEQTREAYLDQCLMMNYLPVARYLNALPGKVKVYVLGETRSYYFQKPVTTVTVYDANPLLQWLEAGPTAETVGQRLRAGGYTHVFVHAQEAVRTRGYEPYLWSPPAVSRYQEWLAHYTRRVAVQGELALYELLAQPNLAPPVKPGRPLFTYSPEVCAKVAGHADAALGYLRQQRWLDAEVEWQRCMALAPEWEMPYAMLGWQYRQQKRWDEAWAAYHRAESLVDLDPVTCNDLGAMAGNLGQAAEARRWFHLALEQEPDFKLARQNLKFLETTASKPAPAGSH
jgi:4-amino-4-deoxy-L-arabinose transferase-like glycosyltransferase